MRYLKYIILSLLTSILTLSCVKELEDPTPIQQNAALTLVPRVKSFSNQYVTKAYTSEEAKITRLAILVFDENGNLIHLQEGSDDAGINSLPLNKSILNKPSATVVMFANVNLSNIRNASGKSILDNQSGLNIRDLPGYAFHFDSDKTVITDLGSSFKGFPMAGIRENVNLSPTATQQGAVDISLQILYAKVNFSIGVENGNENTGTGMKFAMTGYSIHNVSTQMSLTAPEGATDESAEYSYASATGKAVNKSGTVALNGTPLTFTFYVAESRYEHNSDLTGIYPSDDWLTSVQEEDVKNYDRLTDEAKLNGVKYFYDDLIQQYKPKLADLASGKPGKGKATYVLLKGTYTDYRGTVWTVNYKVYLGKDNALNFHVDRNSEYTNYITIKGIRNNDGFGDEDVWLDHRVTNVSTTDPSGYISITRETLIDAHIEVRPMRVKWEEGKYAGVRVYLPINSKSGTLENWIGIERFTGANCQDSATYCYADGESTGKRRYFTTDLISELQTKEGEFGVQEDTDGRQFIYLQNGDCAWIYFDENTFTGDTRNTAREAVITLEFFDDSGNVKATENYHVKQEPLRLIPTVNYNVESYEEYLHSYDSADKYNLSTTPADYTQQGLAWGLADKTISEDVIVSAAPLDGSSYGINIGLQSYISGRYDFYHKSDVPSGTYYWYNQNSSGNWVTMSSETGLGFTNRATQNGSITIKDMGSLPENAYQYCLSKNKFEVDEDGNVAMVLHWYLPDVYQISHLLNATEDGSSDFMPDDFYWSSQPSFSSQVWEIPLINQEIGTIIEVPANARARSKNDGVKDLPRTSKNRIRCLYSKGGAQTNMTGRTPDGIGGNYSFLMKGNLESGYFHNLLQGKRKDIPEDIETDYLYDDSSFAYPTKANSYGVTGAEFGYEVDKDKNNNPIEGFAVNPQDNWSEYVMDLGIFGEYPTGYYTTLNTYPGLSEMELEKFGRSALDYTIDFGILGKYTLLEIADRLNIDIESWLMIDAYKPKDTTPPSYKTDTQVLTSSSVIDLRTENLPQNASLKPLNDKLKISFSAANSEGNKPDFEYYELLSSTKQTNTRYWIPPTYNWTNHETAPDSQTPTAQGSASVTSTQIYTSESQAKDAAYTGVLGSGARPRAENTARSNLITKISQEYPDYNYNEADIQIKEISVDYTTSRNIIRLWKATCNVVVEASVTVTKGGSKTLYTQVSGTGCWGEPVVGNKESAGAEVTTDEFRMYGGNSFTITCTDPEYEITKVKIYYEGSSQISQSGLTTYHARFVDSETAADLPIVGDETDHLRGMEYSESDGWQQWSGTGSDSVTMVLADYMVEAYYDNWWEIFTGAKYNYEYQVPDTGLSNYLVIERIEVKCTKKATASE